MRVIYDVSVLGESQYNPYLRTGVFRVVERVAHGLAAADECELTFAAHQLAASAIRYCRSDARLRQVPFLCGGLPSALIGAVSGLDARFRLEPRAPRWNLAARGLRRLLGDANKHLNDLAGRPDGKALARAEIYHLPGIAPIPEYTRDLPNLKRFVTIYDLTLLSHPHFYPSGQHERGIASLQSLQPEDWVLCISESCRDDLCRLWEIDPAHVFVTPLAADPELFSVCPAPELRHAVRRKYGIPEAPYLLSLSTLQPRKNLDHLIRCFGRLVQQEDVGDLRLVLVGAQGWSEGKIHEEISRLGPLQERVILTGYVADEDLAPLYTEALAFVYPSFYEGFGLPPLEAMQCGVPVITSNTSSLPEVVGDAGLMLDPTDADGLCQQMLELYRKPALRESLSRKSLEQARKFRWERCIQQTIDAYRRAIAS